MAAPIRKVLVAVDGSENSEYAFDWYANNMHRKENTLILAHSPETFVNVTMMSPAKVQEMISEGEAKIKTLENKFSTKMEAHGITGEFLRLEGDKPGSAICECASEHGVTYIVTGTRGLGKFRRTIMGSVSDYVIHHAHVPVLVVRSKEKESKE